MPREYQLYLDDIKNSCQKILRYTQKMSRDQFFKEELVYDAVLRHLLLIGEAAKHLPENIRNQYSNVEWKKICGLRDIIVHAYFGIDNSILWDIIESKIPYLLESLNKIK